MKTFVFLPGTLCDERVWSNQLGNFPGSRFVDLRTQNSIEAMIAAIAAVPEPRFLLAGFSMGGHIAQEFALRYPERVIALVVVGCSSFGYPVEERKRVLGSLELIKRGHFNGVSDKRLHEFLAPSHYENVELRRLIQDMAGADGKEVYLRQIAATIERRDVSAEIQTLKMPIHFIAGRDDQIVPIETVVRSQALSPTAELWPIEDCGHFVPLEQPEQVNRILTDVLTEAGHRSPIS